MIAFVSLFLGLITGPQVIELAVSSEVVAVEIRLDGETVGELHSPPWQLDLDFGEKLTSHRLTAIARDARGEPVDVAVQLLNVPRSAVELEILLDGWRHGVPRHGRLIWHAVEQLEPKQLAVSLDGQPLVLDDDESFELPGLAADTVHFLSAEIELTGNRTATAEAIFGGAFGSTVRTELTAVPIVADGRLPTLDGLRGWFSKDGEDLNVVAFEDGPAEVIFVREEALRERLIAISRSLRGNLGSRSYQFVGLVEPDTVRLLSPRAKEVTHARVQYSIFPISAPWTVKDAPLPDLLWALEFSDPGHHLYGLNDAIAAAGLSAAASQKRRAVVLVTADCAAAQGDRSSETVRQYLEELQVPLHVWMIEPKPKRQAAGGFCADVENVSTARRLLRAVKNLRRTVKQQRIVWVDGRHLPREIGLSPQAQGMRLAR